MTASELLMPILSIEHTQALMMLAGVALLCWMLIRGRMRREPTARPAATATAASAAGLKYNSQAVIRPSSYSGMGSLSAPADALQWQLDLHDLGRELKGELDCKLIAVREMTQAYDRASRRLLALIRAAERVSVSQPGVLQTIRSLQAEGMSCAQIAKRVQLSETDVAELTLLTDMHTS